MQRPGLHRFYTSPTPAMSPARQHFRLANSTPREVKETLDARLGVDVHGAPTINQYIIQDDLGAGAASRVRVALDSNTRVKYAIKEYSKSRLQRLGRADAMKRRRAMMQRPTQDQAGDPLTMITSKNRSAAATPLGYASGTDQAVRPSSAPVSTRPPLRKKQSLDLIRMEFAIMKKLDHPNIVNLVEVLDDPHGDSLFMVLEWCEKGVILDARFQDLGIASPYSEEQCRLYFRDMILGLEYLHSQGVVHRDIKVDNILVSAHDVVKFMDFGVSEVFESNNDRILKTAGSPAYMAPELVALNYGANSSSATLALDHDNISGRAADIWSMGVTLYYIMYGRLPFQAETVSELYHAILHQPVTFPATADQGPYPDSVLRHLFDRLLEKNPKRRITMTELRDHAWVTYQGNDPLLSAEENTADCITPVTEDDLVSAIDRIQGVMDMDEVTVQLQRLHGWRGQLSGVSTQVPSREVSRSPNPDSRLHRALDEIVSQYMRENFSNLSLQQTNDQEEIVDDDKVDSLPRRPSRSRGRTNAGVRSRSLDSDARI